MSAAEPLLTEAEAAAFLQVSRSAMNRWRVVRKGPPFLKLGGRLVRYARADLIAWAESGRKRTEGGEPA